jgi:hypothetical protein
VRGLVPGLVACALLYGNLLWSNGDTDLAHLRSGRRYWEDLSVGIKQYFDATRPASRRTGDIDQAWPSTNGMIVRLVRRAGVPAWQFWRTLPDESVLPLRNQLAAPRPFEDQGRARALGARVPAPGRGGAIPVAVARLSRLPSGAHVGLLGVRGRRPSHGGGRCSCSSSPVRHTSSTVSLSPMPPSAST